MPLGFTQAEADAQAFAIACQKAQKNKVCFSTDAILNSACVGVFYSVGTFVSSPHPPFTFAVTSGTLPPGLAFDAVGLLTGTPTTAGTYNFSVTATDAIGSHQTKPFTLKVVAITSPATLTAATLNSPYTYSLAATGTTFPIVWSVNQLDLPTGLTMNSAGIISGTPTVAGTYNFTATVLDFAGASCSKDFTLVVTAVSALLAYWSFDDYTPTHINDATPHNIDMAAVAGAFGQYFHVPGQVSQGIEINGNDFVNALNPGATDPSVVGFTLCGWIKGIQSGDSGGEVDVSYGLLHDYNAFWAAGDNLELQTPFGNAAMPFPQDGAWHFLRMWLDPATGIAHLQLDMGTAVTVGPFVIPSASGPTTIRFDGVNPLFGTNRFFDEFGIWARVLSDAEANSLYNGGAGTTYPTVPP